VVFDLTCDIWKARLKQGGNPESSLAMEYTPAQFEMQALDVAAR
jgi:hypothetical protein